MSDDRLRQGRKVLRTLYERRGPAPSDGDELVGVVDTPELAAEICAAVNAARDLVRPGTDSGAPDPTHRSGPSGPRDFYSGDELSRPTPPGARGCVCPRCHRVFSAPTPFDRHQRLTATGVECRDPAEVGLTVLRKHDGHPVWGAPPTDAQRALIDQKTD